MFSNPFTPDSQKAKKSIFKNESRGFIIERKISAERIRKIEMVRRHTDYLLKYKLKVDNADFLYALEDHLIKDLQIDEEEAKATIEKILNNRDSFGKNQNGEIIKLNISDLGLFRLPSAIGQLTQLSEFDCSENKLKLLKLDISIYDKEIERIEAALPNAKVPREYQ